jgi:hypothetical protein
MREFSVITRLSWRQEPKAYLVTDATAEEMSAGTDRLPVAEFPVSILHEKHEQQIRAQILRDLLNDNKITY